MGSGVPDINGATSSGEFWLELKVCKTKKYKTAGLWRPHQIAWQANRAKMFQNVWNIVSHPEDDVILVYGCRHILDLNEAGVDVRPDMVMLKPFNWDELIEFINERLRNRSSMDECADA